VRAVVVTRNGGPEVLELQEWPDPEPGDGQLLVRVEAAGINYRDVYDRQGDYGGGAPPKIEGIEGSGVVESVGAGVDEFTTGDVVAWVNAPGSYAELVLVDAERAVRVPAGVSAESAAAAMLQGMTAHYLTTATYPVQPGDWIVVHAAAGGVGLLLTQIAKRRGGHVLATTSTDEKAALARSAGADEATGYEGFAARARELTDGKGVAAVYDGVGATTFDAGLDALRPRGTMVLYGASSGPPGPFDLRRLQQGGSLFVTRPTLVHYTATRDELLERAGDVLAWVADGSLDVRIGHRYPLDAARQAHEDLEGRRTTGKLLLLP
jgi:NADPH2:quinone reductase